DFPTNIYVAQEGELVWILDAFFGNSVSQVDVWSVILTKLVTMKKPLMEVLDQWRAGNATVQGKKHVIQMLVGGVTSRMTLTNVQHMPDMIVKRLTKVI
ncbi:hypothetical protein L227DRAFT_509979, partial [Lentinus tigrinus ALCF2SS1-6]